MPIEDMDSPPIEAQDSALDHNQVPPAEPPAPQPTPEAAADTPDPDDVPLSDEEHAEAEAKKKKTGSQRLREKNARLEAELAFYREQMARPAAPPVDAPPPVQAPGPDFSAPTPDQFTTYEAYQQAVIAHEVTKRLEAERQRTEFVQLKSQYDKRVSETRAAHQDYDEVVTPMLVNAIDRLGLGMAIATSEVGPQVLYHLGQHPEDLNRIAGLNPLAAARELGRLESRLGSKSTPKPPTKTTQAPPPLPPARSAGASSVRAYTQLEDF